MKEIENKDPSILSSLFMEIQQLRNESLPRLYEKTEQKFNEIKKDIQTILDKLSLLDKDHTITKTKVDVLWWIVGLFITGTIGLFFWLIKGGG